MCGILLLLKSSEDSSAIFQFLFCFFGEGPSKYSKDARFSIFTGYKFAKENNVLKRQPLWKMSSVYVRLNGSCFTKSVVITIQSCYLHA